MEQRNEGKQTIDRLEAMQQDMVRLLERVEGLETRKPEAQPHVTRRIVPGQGEIAATHALPAAASPASQAHSQLVAAPTQPVQPAASPAATAAPAKPQPQPADAQAPTNQTAPASAPDAEPELPAVAQDRSRFLAEARRAAAQANARLQQDDEDGLDSLDDAVMASHSGSGETATASPRTSRTRLAVAALALIAVGLGASNMVFNWTAPGKPSAAATQQEAPEAAGRKAAEPAQTPPPQPSEGSAAPAERSHASVELNGDVLPAGVSLTPAANRLSAERVAAFEQRQEEAALSTRVGASQPVATAIPTSLIPQKSLEQTALGASVGTSGTLAGNLPSALVGPLSLRIAAADGDPSASFEVGARFAEGKGVRQDFREAVKWYTRAATQGFAIAQYRLATLHERGLGVDTDTARAKIWYERAARQGNVKAMHNLAVLIAGGKAGPTDYGSAAHWFTEAAERGLADSQFNLAILLENGLGVSKDLAKAYKWFGLAARSGDADADRRRKGLVSKLDPSAVAASDASISQWRRRPVSRLANDAHFAGTQWQQRKTGKSSS
jgi:localization factor PodJL